MVPATDWTKPVGELRRRVSRAWAVRRTVRGRATVVAMAVIAVALAVALAIVLLLYRGQLQAGLDQTLEQQVVDRARLLDEGSSPETLTTVLQDEALVWIGTPDGDMLAIGGAIFPLDSPLPPSIGGVTTIELLVEERKPDEIERERMSLRVASALTSDGRIVVLAGAEDEVVSENVGRLARLFLGALPILTLLAGATVWAVAGRVLRPVEEMRARADEITGANLDARVPEPGTGDEIHDLAVTMNSMLDRLESHDQALRDFTADASHELKSPVANLRALLDTTELDDPKWAELRSRLGGESDRLRDLVDNLLFLASHQADAPVVQGDSVSLDDLLFDEAELLAATGRVSVDLSGIEPVVVDGERAALVRLVRNLVDNAARHATDRVALSASEGPDGVVLVVADDGPGIDPADRQRIFDRFTRLDEARARDSGGSGLGLAIVERIALDHAATVEVVDSDLGGAKFVVRFSADQEASS